MTAPLRQNGHLVAAVERRCSHKNRYCDEATARAMGITQSIASGYKIYVYPCTICKGWHLTKSPQADRRREAGFFQPTPR